MGSGLLRRREESMIGKKWRQIVVCKRCKGLGKLYGEDPCEYCGGSGRMVRVTEEWRLGEGEEGDVNQLNISDFKEPD